MKWFLFVLCLASTRAFAGNSCDNPTPQFGKVIATCGHFMITYVGDESTKLHKISVTQSRFELVHCDNGVRTMLNVNTNSEGYILSTMQIPGVNMTEKYDILNVWHEFYLVGTDERGESVKLTCSDYKDTRTDINYLCRNVCRFYQSP